MTVLDVGKDFRSLTMHNTIRQSTCRGCHQKIEPKSKVIINWGYYHLSCYITRNHSEMNQLNQEIAIIRKRFKKVMVIEKL